MILSIGMGYGYTVYPNTAQLGGGIPENALVTDDGTPIVTDDGSFILTSSWWAAFGLGIFLWMFGLAQPAGAQGTQIIDLTEKTACVATDNLVIQETGGGAGSTKRCEFGSFEAGDLSDVNLTGILTNGMLRWNGTSFVATSRISVSSTADEAVLITPASATQVGLTVQGVAGQTADVARAETSAGSTLFRVDPSGGIGNSDSAPLGLSLTNMLALHRAGNAVFTFSGSASLTGILYAGNDTRAISLSWRNANQVVRANLENEATTLDQVLSVGGAEATRWDSADQTLTNSGPIVSDDYIQPGPSSATCDADTDGSIRVTAAVAGVSATLRECCEGTAADPVVYSWGPCS